MIVIGLRGIVKNKWPRYKDGPGFAIDTNYYFSNYVMFVGGIIFLIIEIRSYF